MLVFDGLVLKVCPLGECKELQETKHVRWMGKRHAYDKVKSIITSVIRGFSHVCSWDLTCKISPSQVHGDVMDVSEALTFTISHGDVQDCLVRRRNGESETLSFLP